MTLARCRARRQGGVEAFAVVLVPTRDPLVRAFAPGRYELEFGENRGLRGMASFTIGADLAPCEVALQSSR